MKIEHEHHLIYEHYLMIMGNYESILFIHNIKNVQFLHTTLLPWYNNNINHYIKTFHCQAHKLLQFLKNK